MRITRRHFLQTSSVMSAATLVPPPLSVTNDIRRDDPDPDGILFRAFALRAIDAAQHAGATYADVRLTRTVSLRWINGSPGEGQRLAVGVRALVNGYWGFASGPYWTLDEMRRLAEEAVAQATVSAQGKARAVTFTPIPVATGTWSTPVKIDPFSLPYEEQIDFYRAWGQEPKQYQFGAAGGSVLQVQRLEKTCASTEGSLFTQTLYTIGGKFTVGISGTRGQSLVLPLVGAGWEYVQEADIFSAVPRLIDEGRQQKTIPNKAVEVGRYDMVFDASSMASLTAASLGRATQLDRALGYEANAGGTSFLNAPLEMLGTTQLASPLVTVTADRTLSRGVATACWDDEGVAVTPFPLVQDGILVDYQTTREQAAWLAPYYERARLPTRSHGCSNTESAIDLPMQHPPNLIVEPGHDDVGFDDLVAQVSRGYAVIGGVFDTDFQQRTGSGKGVIREIVNGTLGAVITNAGVLFTTDEIWKNIIALGGERSLGRDAYTSRKGEPSQSSGFSVRAVPALLRDIALIDVTRKA